MDSLNIQQTILWPLNTVNFAVGVAQNSNLSYISAIIGIVLNVMWHLYKFYRQIRLDAKVDSLPIQYATTATTTDTDIDAAPFERRCVSCAKPFEPIDANQIFCGGECWDNYLVELKNRKPYPNAN